MVLVPNASFGLSPAIPIALAIIALLYAMVGHGGASGYIALLMLLGFASDEVRTTALVLNLIVSGIGTAQFAGAGHFRWQLFLPFAITSVPMAWIGAHLQLDALVYKRLLAVCLLMASARLLGLFRSSGSRRRLNIVLALLIGAGLGLLSGAIGIGGGILLSPLLLIIGWADAHETAAVSAPFILVNSAAGLMGAWMSAHAPIEIPWPWVGAAIAGGALGAWLGARRLNAVWLRRALGAVLIFACVKLVLP